MLETGHSSVSKGLPSALRGTRSGNAAVPGGGTNTGSFSAKAQGNYVFRLSSDDGSLLWIDGEFLVNNDGVHAATSKSNTITLDKGVHKIWVFYFQAARPDVALQLFVTVPGAAEQLWSPEF